MSETLVIGTHFDDLASFAEGLKERVDGQRLMLYGPTSYAEGEVIQFTVLLSDSSVALEGMGRAAASIDGGEERPPEARWDVVLDSLQLDEYSTGTYQQMVAANQGAQPTAEARAAEARAAEAHARSIEEDLPEEEATVIAPMEEQFVEALYQQSDEMEQDVERLPSDAPTVIHDGDVMQLAQSMAPSSPPPAEDDAPTAEVPGMDEAVEMPVAAPSQAPAVGLRLRPSEGALIRPIRAPSWYPESQHVPEPRPASGLFAYEAGPLPLPTAPPRPHLEPSLRIVAAPRPSSPPPQAAEAPVADE